MRIFFLLLLLSSLAALVGGCTGDVLTVDMVDLTPDGSSSTSGPHLDASRSDTLSSSGGHDAGHGDAKTDSAAPADATTESAPTGETGAKDAGSGDAGPDTSSPPPSEAGRGDAVVNDAAIDHEAGGGEPDATPEVTIGGSVTGLSVGETVVLQNNGTNNTTVTGGATTSASVPFTFSSAVPVGSTYKVTVLTQPTNSTLSCAVTSGGMGMAPSSPVTNVIVTCAPLQKLVYVMLSGLATSKNESVILQLNGADSMTLTMNGTSSFSTPVTAGYKVTVQQNPATQICVVQTTTSSWAVAVVCTDAFSVGGILTGLAAGATVAIEDNGVDSTTLAANGRFTFPTLVASGHMYNVSVSAEETGCAVIGTTGMGTVGSADVTSVEIQCGEVSLAPATQNGATAGIASDGTYVYWVNSAQGAINQRSIVGGGVTTLSTGNTGAAGLAVSGTATGEYVYWTNPTAGTVMRISALGGTATTVAMTQTHPTDIAVTTTATADQKIVVWTDSVPGGNIMMVTGSGGPAALSGNDPNVVPMGIATDGSNVYWTTAPANTLGHGGVWAISLSGSPLNSGTAPGPTMIAPGSSPLGIVVSAGNVYWTDPGAGTVSAIAVPTTAGAANAVVNTVASSLVMPEYIAADTGNVYWTSHVTPGSVYSAAIGDPTMFPIPPTPVAAGPSAAYFIAVDATNVYWTTDATPGGAYQAPK